jgi:H+-translocating NAD(P) transhydrogenase subunit alpha
MPAEHRNNGISTALRGPHMAVRIGVPKETDAREQRVAVVPDGVRALVRGGATVVVERGAGARAYYGDALYETAGATLAGDAAAIYDSDVVVKVQRPAPDEIARLRRGTLVISLMAPASHPETIRALLDAGVTALALELVPRITRAQSMDVLSSQSTVAGYKAVLIAADALPRLLPMMTTAAGSLPPAKTFVLGAGVAGLQAIATARRLGAVVSAFDVRAAAREQVASLGATFVATESVSADGETAGGYAKEQSEDQQRRIAAAIGGHITDMDIVISTAQIPGRPAPRLISAEMVHRMRPGSVIVDLAAEAGGNCELTRPGETVEAGGVRILGPLNVPSMLPFHASQMFSKNVVTLLLHLIKNGALAIDMTDEITRAMAVTNGVTA